VISIDESFGEFVKCAWKNFDEHKKKHKMQKNMGDLKRIKLPSKN